MENSHLDFNQLQNGIGGMSNMNIMMGGNNLVNNSMDNPHHGIPSQEQQSGSMMENSIPIHDPHLILDQIQLHDLPMDVEYWLHAAPMGAMGPENNFKVNDQNTQPINVEKQPLICTIEQPGTSYNVNAYRMSVDNPFPPQPPQTNVCSRQQREGNRGIHKPVVIRINRRGFINRSKANTDKRKIMSHQLVLLLHAQQCQSMDNQANGEVRQCRWKYCNMMKGILAHVVNCSDGRNCKVGLCSSSRQVLSHWKHCSKTDCYICQEVKASKHRIAPANNNQTSNTAGMNHTVNNGHLKITINVTGNSKVRVIKKSNGSDTYTEVFPDSQTQPTTTMNPTDVEMQSVNNLLNSIDITSEQSPSTIQKPTTNILNSKL